MLQPRESDIPVLFLVLVVLPLVTYILLGIWNEAAKKKAKIRMLADLAAEEACSVEATAPTNYGPPGASSKATSHVCAKCFAPATTRCARCKSIRYCSGKCQIIHWRQGHREECQQWQESCSNLSAVFISVTKSVGCKPSVNEKSALQMLGDDLKELRHSNVSSDLDDPHVTCAATSSDTTVGISKVSTSEKTLSDKWVPNALERDMCSYYNVASFPEDSVSPDAAAPTLHSTTLFTEVSLKNIPLKHKSGKENFIVSGKDNFSASDGPHRKQDRTPIFTKAPAVLKNIMHHSQKSTGKVRNVSRPSSSPEISSSMTVDRNVINDYECGMDFSSEKVDFQNGKFSSAGETLELSTAAERNLGSGRINYKKPPYMLDAAISLSTKLVDKVTGESSLPQNERDTNIENESRFSHRSVSTNIPSQSCNGFSDMGEIKMAGPRKSPKVPRQNLVGFINSQKKNKVLFPYEDLVKLFQCETWHISPRGLLNCGNSCYANAVLQCLTCTKPLMIYLLQRQHSRACRVRDWCLMCELEQHVSMLRDGMGSLSPNRILSNMRQLGWRMGDGNQEDAHEFLRLLVMSMQSIFLEGLGGEEKVDQVLQETTLIQQIFGGRLRSKVKCMRCHHESERYENIMDLTLEIHGWVESLQDALTQFTAPEDLDGENMYRCGRCSAYVKARKQLSVHEVPNILTVVLKRFQSGQYGKINKCVTFPDMLDMIPFMTGTADNPPLYLLYAVVVHLDTFNASFSGHYVSYIKDLQGTWFRMDDSKVQPVPLNQVMSEGAYMLFYSRPFPRPPRTYFEKSPLPSLHPSNHITLKTLESSRYGKDKQDGPVFASEFSSNNGNAFKPEYSVGNEEYIQRSSSRTINPSGETYGDSFNMEFSDATSSDWSLFTSSDESSFTTESTRDSFSTVDHGDGAGLDSISAIFSPFYGPDYSHSNAIYHTKFSPCKSERIFS